MILRDCFIEIDGVNYSGQGTNAAINTSVDTTETKAFGQTTKKHNAGIKDWSMAFELYADEAVNGQDLFELLGQEVNVKVRASTDPVAAGNPSYEGLGVVTEYEPLSGGVDDEHKVSVSIVAAGDLSRVTV